jgi:ParB family chromosome partitioning protein
MNAIKKQKGLGRGLDALLGDAPKTREEEAGHARGRSTLPLEFIRPNPDQPRRHFAEDAIDELAASIRARGLLQPILVRPAADGAFEIVAGERRWRAAQKAQLHDVPVIIRELTDDEAAEIALIENVQRVDLNPVEEARAYQRLNEVYNRTQEEISKAVGKSRSHVANAVRLLLLPPKSLQALAEGKISAGHARAILGAPRPDVITAMVIGERLSVRETEHFVKLQTETDWEKRGIKPNEGILSEAKRPPGGRKDADTKALEADLSAALGLEVDISHTPKGAGTIALKYRNLDQLDELVRRLMGQRI